MQNKFSQAINLFQTPGTIVNTYEGRAGENVGFHGLGGNSSSSVRRLLRLVSGESCKDLGLEFNRPQALQPLVGNSNSLSFIFSPHFLGLFLDRINVYKEPTTVPNTSLILSCSRVN